MKWDDLTDRLFCNAYGHFFTIAKPAFRNDVCRWYCLDKDFEYVGKGGTTTITAAKIQCKKIYNDLKANDKTVYVKNNGKLTRKKYGRIQMG